MNTDPRGVKRGKCSECDCTMYEYTKGKGPTCNYCLCPPTKHARIDIDEETTFRGATSPLPLNNITTLCVVKGEPFSLNECTQPQYSYELAYAGVSPHNPAMREISSNESLQSECSYELDYKSVLPKRLPLDITTAMRNNKLSPKLRNKVVRSIAERCHAESIPKTSVGIIADIAVQRWSSLKSLYGHRSKALAMQIKKRMYKLQSTKSAQTSIELEEDETLCVDQCKEMENEYLKPMPSIKKIQYLMSALRENRKKDACRMTVEDHILKYPSLKFPEMILWEFTEMMNISEKLLTERMTTFVSKMCKYLDLEGNCTDIDILTVQILEALPTTLVSGKRTTDGTKCILQVFPEQTPLSQTVPNKTDAPRLVAIGDSKKAGLYLTCYVDGKPLLTTSNAIKASLLLLSTYWVFNIKFPTQSRPSLLVLGAILLKACMPVKELQNCSSANGLLKQLNL